MATVHYNPNIGAISTQIMRKGGDVDGDIKRRALRVAKAAKPLVPNTSGRGTGELAASIHVEQTRAERGRFGFGYRVIADARHAAAVHGGSRAHFIPAAPALAFDWKGSRFVVVPAFRRHGSVKRIGGVTFVRSPKGGVNIPRRKGNPFLTKALRVVG